MTKSQIKQAVLTIYKEVYGADQTEKEILKTDPNSFDKDPALFYEQLESEFNLKPDYDHYPNFGGLGGTVAETIDFIFRVYKLETVATNEDKCLFSFFDNYGSNFKTLTKENIKMYLNMFSMMEGPGATKMVKERLKLALQHDDWDGILKVLSKVKQKKVLFDPESLKKIAAEIGR